MARESVPKTDPGDGTSYSVCTLSHLPRHLFARSIQDSVRWCDRTQQFSIATEHTGYSLKALGLSKDAPHRPSTLLNVTTRRPTTNHEGPLAPCPRERASLLAITPGTPYPCLDQPRTSRSTHLPTFLCRDGKSWWGAAGGDQHSAPGE